MLANVLDLPHSKMPAIAKRSLAPLAQWLERWSYEP